MRLKAADGLGTRLGVCMCSVFASRTCLQVLSDLVGVVSCRKVQPTVILHPPAFASKADGR